MKLIKLDEAAKAIAFFMLMSCNSLASDAGVCTPTAASIKTCVTGVPWISQYDPRPGTQGGTRNCGQTCVYMIKGLYSSMADVAEPPCANCLTPDGIVDIDYWLHNYPQFKDALRLTNNGPNGQYTSGSRKDRLPTLASKMYGFIDSHYYENWTPAQLDSELSQGHPVIVGVYTYMDRSRGVPHWMVLVGLDDTWAWVNDPGRSVANIKQAKYWHYSRALFDDAWSGQVVVIHPGDYWPTYQHDSRHSGLSPDIGPPTSDSRVVYDIGTGNGAPFPVVGPTGLIYFAVSLANSYSWKLIAVDGSGAVALKTETYEGSPSESTPTVAPDGSVYLAVRTSTTNTPYDLYCFFPDGRFKWKRSMSAFYGSVTIGSDGTVYVASGFWQSGCLNYLYALDPANGSDKWPPYSYGCVNQLASAAVAPNGNIIVVGSLGYGYTVNTHSNSDGSILWSVGYPRIDSAGGSPSPAAVAPDGTIYFWGEPKLWRISPDGQQVSSTQRLVAAGVGAWASTPAIAPDGSIRIALSAQTDQTPARLFAFSASLQPIWSADLVGPSQDTPGNPRLFDSRPQVAVDAAGSAYVSLNPFGCSGPCGPIPLIFMVDTNGSPKWSSSATYANTIILSGPSRGYAAMFDGVSPSWSWKIYSFEPALVGQLDRSLRSMPFVRFKENKEAKGILIPLGSLKRVLQLIGYRF